MMDDGAQVDQRAQSTGYTGDDDGQSTMDDGVQGESRSQEKVRDARHDSDKRQRLRMVVKIGSSSITDELGHLSEAKLAQLVDQVARIEETGLWQVVLVSSGAVATGLSKLGWRRQNITMPEKQAAASVGQGLLMHTYEQLFRGYGMNIGQVLLTKSDVEDRGRFVHIRNTLLTLLRFGVVPIVNENDTVAVDEIRFGDNDTLASLVALVTEAQQLVLLTDIDGLYTANPTKDAQAKLIMDVYEITAELEAAAGSSASQVGTGGMRTKLTAAKMAVAGGCDVVVAAAQVPDVLLRAAAEYENKNRAVTPGNKNSVPTSENQNGAVTPAYKNGSVTAQTGTRFHAHADPVSLRKTWLLHGSKAQGQIHIDAGAARAIVGGTASLLLPGVTHVEGDFRESATVDLVGPDGVVVGRGIISLSAQDLVLLLGRRRAGEQLRSVPPLVHRNDLAIQRNVKGAGVNGHSGS